MAKDKKSFIIYTDSRGLVDKLSNERAGILFKTLFSYCDDEDPVCNDEVIDIVFEHFKSILKRDLKKYEKIVDRNRRNGKNGGRPKNPVGFFETETNPNEPKKADTDNVNDTDTDTDNVNDILSNKNLPFFNELFSAQSWLEVTAMQSRGKFTTDQVKDKLKEFDNTLLSKFDFKLNKTDYASHFVSWLNLQPKPLTTEKIYTDELRRKNPKY